MYSDSDVERLQVIDGAIVRAAKSIKILSALSWAPQVQSDFLQDLERGQPGLPQVSYERRDLSAERQALTGAMAGLDAQDPMEGYLRATAESYIHAIDLIDAAGTPRMQPFADAIYATPGDALSGGVDNLHAAEHFLSVSESYERQNINNEPDYCLGAQVLRADLEQRLAEVFPPGTVEVVVDKSLASKAAAGATRIRLRDGTCFSEYDIEQLLQHEAFVHSLTALNGRAQPHFKTLSLGAPRTTGPQEGLATFSELVTGAIDIRRTERIALRVIGVDMALKGADFIEVFRFFQGHRQNAMESFSSAMRVFRGAPLTGGCAFTKDVVYLHGLMEVHTFFRWALLHEKLALTRYFFAGRMTIDDAVRLAPLFDAGILAGPRYLPPWLTRTNGLAGYLAFSVFANRIKIAGLGEGHGFDGVGQRGEVEGMWS